MSTHHFFKTALSYKGKVLANYQYQQILHKQLLETVISVLPKPLSNHVLYCMISKRKAILYTDAAVWSSQLRFYHQPMLHALIKLNEKAFDSLHIKIMPKMIDRENNRTAQLPSSETIDFIVNQAEHKAVDELQIALLKLGNTLKKRSKK